MGQHDSLAATSRQVDAAAMRAVSPLPPPEEVFVDWLMSVPHDASLEEAARRKIAVIARCDPLHPDVFKPRTLLAVIAGGSAWPNPVSNF